MEIKNVMILRFSKIPDLNNCIQDKDIKIELNELEYPVLLSYNKNQPIGNCKIFRKEDGLYADIHIIDEFGTKPFEKGLSPGIGFDVLKSRFRKKTKTRVIKKIKLWCVSLFPGKNADLSIGPIRKIEK